LYISLTGDGGSAAHADALMLSDGRDLGYQARRRGSGFIGGQYGEFSLDWQEALRLPSARHIAIALEKSQGVHLPLKSPPTTPKALGYRLMASILEMTLGDRQVWSTGEIEGGPLDPKNAEALGALREWEGVRWELRRDDELVAVLDNFGWLESDSRTIPLHRRYRELGGRLPQLTLEILGRSLA
jgi:hypothetical protein